MHFDAVVLGGGVIGITTAYWLAREGKSVCVVERQPQAGLETSFANGGQISVSHAEPWANPSAPLKVMKWLFDGKAPLLFRPKFDVHQWLWIAQFMIDCLPERADNHTAEIVKLATESRTHLQAIRKRENIHYDERTKGILHFYRDPREYEAALRVAELMKTHGCECNEISLDEMRRLEPAFKGVEGIVGATYTAEDESGDAKKFTQGLADVCARMGVTFLYGSEVVKLRTNQANMRPNFITKAEVRTPEGYVELEARDFVVSLGSFSAPFLRPYGVHLNIYPAKGYSVTIPIRKGDIAPEVSLTDDEIKLVYSNLGDRLRVAGTAELSGYTKDLNLDRCEAILSAVMSTFPKAGDFGKTQFWTGLRPTTPSNVPYVGKTRRYDNLWLNTGHGTLGWTMACGSGARLIEKMAAERKTKIR